MAIFLETISELDVLMGFSRLYDLEERKCFPEF